MKTKFLLTAALIGAVSLSAHAGVRFCCSVGLPLPPFPVPVVTVATPAPVVCATPAPIAYVAPAPVVTVTPPCPVAGYVWAPGYWAGRVWVGGYWHAPVHVAYGHPYYYGHPYGGRRW